ncbi:MAG: hypothetical protein DME69_00565 [Verrucomicrobia bacterium]|nr:MAG: hypothetical protein DME69_00565 [Verrucomicrobiota bacterium]
MRQTLNREGTKFLPFSRKGRPNDGSDKGECRGNVTRVALTTRFERDEPIDFMKRSASRERVCGLQKI